MKRSPRLVVAAVAFVCIGIRPGEAAGQDRKIPPGQPAADASVDNLLRGVVAKVGDPFKEGLKVQCAQGAFCFPMLLIFDKDTKIVFANRKKATVADLKPGRWISFKHSANLEPMGISRARVELVVLDPPDDGTFPVHSLAVSRDRKWIATVGITFGVAPPVIRVVLVNAESGQVVRELECDTQPINKLVFSPDGKLLYGGVDPVNSGNHFYNGLGSLVVWDVATGKSVKEMGGLWALSPDGGRAFGDRQQLRGRGPGRGVAAAKSFAPQFHAASLRYDDLEASRPAV